MSFVAIIFLYFWSFCFNKSRALFASLTDSLELRAAEDDEAGWFWRFVTDSPALLYALVINLYALVISVNIFDKLFGILDFS